MPLDYLSCLAVVLRGIHRKVDICQTDYSIQTKNFPLFWSCTWKYIQANKWLTKVKEKSSTTKFGFFILSFKCNKQKWCVLFLTCIKLVVCVLACVHAVTCIKWRRLRKRQKERLQTFFPAILDGLLSRQAKIRVLVLVPGSKNLI